MKAKSHQFTAIISALILFYLAEPYFMWAGFLGTIYTRTILAFIMGLCFYSNRKSLNGYEIFLLLVLLGSVVISAPTHCPGVIPSLSSYLPSSFLTLDDIGE